MALGLALSLPLALTLAFDLALALAIALALTLALPKHLPSPLQWPLPWTWHYPHCPTSGHEHPSTISLTNTGITIISHWQRFEIPTIQKHTPFEHNKTM